MPQEKPAPLIVGEPKKTATSSFTSLVNTELDKLSPDDYLRRADNARMKGDNEGAIQALSVMVERFPDDPRSAVSIFQLSLLEARLGRTSSAELRLTRLIQSSVSESLREDAYLRLIELQNSHSPGSSRLTAQEYLRKFPNGRHGPRVREMFSSDE